MTVAETELVIEAGRTGRNYWRDLFRYRELFYFLAWRDVLVRYKQTVIGVLWAVIRPFLTTVVFVFAFNRIAKLPSEGVPYPVMVFAAMLPWQLFATSLSECSNSLIGNANLISKIYFPRMIVPASAVIVAFVDFVISCGLLALFMIFYHVLPAWQLVTLPVFVTIALPTSVGAGLWFAALNVEYRDFRYIVPFVVQFGIFITPVGFSSSLIRDKYGDTIFMLYSLNPMVGVIDGFRWAISGGRSQLFLPGLLASAGITLFLLITGAWYFRKMERTFADVI